MNKISLLFMIAIFFTLNAQISAKEIKSKLFEIYEIEQQQDKNKIKELISNLPKNYSHFVPTDDNVSVRQGPGVSFGKHGVLTKNVDRHQNGQDIIEYSNLKNIGVDTYLPWVGGIVSNEVLPGDENCSGWQEIVTLEMTWLSFDFENGYYPDYSGLDDNALPAYVCIDFIETNPISQKDIANFQERHFPNYNK